MTQHDSVDPESRFGAALSALRHEVTAGRFRQHDMLPGERELAELLGISRTTLRRVLAVLVDEAILIQRQGVGTFVRRAAASAPEPTQARMIGFEEDMRRRGLVASWRDIEQVTGRPTAEETMVLACAPETPVLRLARILHADDEPMAVERRVIPIAFLDDPDTAVVGAQSVVDRPARAIARALQRVQAVVLEDVDAARLGVPYKSAGLAFQRASFLTDGRCCEFIRSVYRADRYDLVFELRGPLASPPAT